MTASAAQHQPRVLPEEGGRQGVDPGAGSLEQLTTLVAQHPVDRFPVLSARKSLNGFRKGAVLLEQHAGSAVRGLCLDFAEFLEEHLLEV